VSEREDVEAGLRYIAESPPCSRGGFHEEAVRTARMALDLIANLADDSPLSRADEREKCARVCEERAERLEDKADCVTETATARFLRERASVLRGCAEDIRCQVEVGGAAAPTAKDRPQGAGSRPRPQLGNSDAVAKIKIVGAGEMTPEGREEVAAWLRRQANALVADGQQYAPRFRASYFAREWSVGGGDR
jgi:hypothetical protein